MVNVEIPNVLFNSQFQPSQPSISILAKILFSRKFIILVMLSIKVNIDFKMVHFSIMKFTYLFIHLFIYSFKLFWKKNRTSFSHFAKSKKKNFFFVQIFYGRDNSLCVKNLGTHKKLCSDIHIYKYSFVQICRSIWKFELFILLNIYNYLKIWIICTIKYKELFENLNYLYY